jgi:hypothetical protein
VSANRGVSVALNAYNYNFRPPAGAQHFCAFVYS